MKSLTVLACSTLVLAACTSRARRIQIDNQPLPSDSANPIDGGAGNGYDDGSGVSASTELTRDALVAAYADIDLNNLSYKFSYLTKQQEDKITFDAAGKAVLTFRSLPAGQSGTVSLEILEAAVVKFRATAENVTLNAGQANSLNIVLKAVDGSNGGGNGGGGSGGSTDLVLEVSLGSSGGSGGSTNPPPSNPLPNNPPPSNPLPNNPPPSNPSNPTDPVANWDGKTNQGNSRWRIVPIDG